MTLNNNYQLVGQAYLGNSGYGNVYIRTYAKLNSQSISSNKSNISVQARIYTEGAYWYATSGTTYRITGSNSIDSGTISCNGQYNAGETTLGTITKDISHFDNGSRTIHLESNFTSQPWGWNATASASNISLPDIPRASSVSCSSPYIGDTATITIGKKVSSFTSTVTYKIGTLTGTIATKTNETVLSLNTELLKDQIYALIPNSKSTAGVITCTTYNGNTKIGDSTTANFNLYAKEDECKPDVSGTVIDTNEKTIAITGSNTKFIKYASKPKVTVNATAKNSATIKSYSINLNDGQSSSQQETTFNKIGSNSIIVDSTDSRGYNNPTTLELDMIDYIELHINKVNLERPEGTSNEVKLDCNGVWFNDNFNENTPNTLSISFQYKESSSTGWIDGGEITPTIENNTFKIINYSLGNIYDYEKEYQFKIIISDLLMTVGSTDKESQTVPKGLEVWWESEDGIGVNGHIWLNDISFQSNVRQLTGYKIIADEADINTIIEHGTYRSESTAHTATMKNVPVVPTGSTGGFTLYVMGYTSTVTNRSFVRQELIIASYTYVRHTTNGGSSWSEWIDMSKDISIITVFSKNQKHTGGNWSVISFKLTSEIKVGNAFTRNTNNTIKVNKNLKGVIASATMNLTTDSYSYSGDLYIIQERDGKTFKQMDCRANDGNGLKHMSTSPVLFNDVKKNDVFYFGHYTNSGSDTFTTVNGDSTYLTLTEVS